LPKTRYSRSIERRRPGPQFAALVLSEIAHADLPKVNFVERHGAAANCRFGLVVHFVYEHHQPLIAGSMEIDRSPDLPRGFDLNAFRSRFHLIGFIDALDNQVGMTVEILVFRQGSRMPCEACGQHIRQKTRHDCRAKHVIQPLQSPATQ